MKQKIIITIILLIIGLQFIRPKKNLATQIAPTDIRNQYDVPANVLSVLEKACFDCHSNNSRYPWYTNIQPLGWYLAHHIDEGKAELNFSEFATYPTKKAHHKIEEVQETLEKQEMPLASYTLVHKDANLTDAEKQLLINWSKSLRTEIIERNK